MKIYAVSTLTSDWLCKTIFLPSIYRTEPLAEVHIKEYPFTGNENYASPGYVQTLLRRLENILIWIEENMGDLILISDVDILYIRPFISEMERQAADYDVTGQCQWANERHLNFGQTLIRCSPKTLTLFKYVYEECRLNNDLDQDVLNRQLKASNMRYTTLTSLFAHTGLGYFPDMYSYHTIYSVPIPGRNSIQAKVEQFEELHKYLISINVPSWK